MKIDDITVEVKAILGKTKIPLEAYGGLRVNDIIILEQKIEDGLEVTVSESLFGRATAGLFETHKAVVLDERIYP